MTNLFSSSFNYNLKASTPRFPVNSPSPSRSPTNNAKGPSVQQRRRASSNSPLNLPALDTTPLGDFDGTKDASAAHDWYPENHSRLAVPYDDLTAIDWIHEYSKERARLRHLHASTTHPAATTQTQLLGYARQIADDSQTWLILVATGIAVGAIAAGIDVAVDWLADLKTGVCKNHGDGGAFYLNKMFCCWGYDDYEQCPDWKSWSSLMGVDNKGGSWIIDFIFYFMSSVSIDFVPTIASLSLTTCI